MSSKKTWQQQQVYVPGTLVTIGVVGLRPAPLRGFENRTHRGLVVAFHEETVHILEFDKGDVVAVNTTEIFAMELL